MKGLVPICPFVGLFLEIYIEDPIRDDCQAPTEDPGHGRIQHPQQITKLKTSQFFRAVEINLPGRHQKCAKQQPKATKNLSGSR